MSIVDKLIEAVDNGEWEVVNQILDELDKEG